MRRKLKANNLATKRMLALVKSNQFVTQITTSLKYHLVLIVQILSRRRRRRILKFLN